MKDVAVLIPAKGNSSELPGKNMRHLGGIPLVSVSILQGLALLRADGVYVSTDSMDIRFESICRGARVIERPPELATETAGTLGVINHALKYIPQEWLILLQPTNPFRKPGALREALPSFFKSGYRNGFSGQKYDGFVWKPTESGRLKPMNRDWETRRRRQDKPPLILEDGAFYIFHREVCERPDWLWKPTFLFPGFNGVDIHTMEDLELARGLWSEQWLGG